MLKAFIDQYTFWTWNHALYDPWGDWGKCREISVVVGMLVALFALQYVLVPEKHLMLGLLPFLCLMAVKLPGRVHGLMDSYYYASVVKKLGPIEGPVFTNWPGLYFVNDWGVPGEDFLTQIQSCYPPNWEKPPLSEVKTRILFMHTREDFPEVDAPIVPLERGVYRFVKVAR